MKALLKYREVWLLAAIVVLIGLISTRFPAFADPANLRQVFNDTSILMILALGQMAIILTRSIDLSMASNLCFTGMVVAMLNAAHPAIPIPLLIVIALLVGLVLGAINGLLVWRLNIPSIVVTLAPSACTARTEQLLTDWPSIRTVHAPQLLVSQPTTVPTLPSRSRR